MEPNHVVCLKLTWTLKYTAGNLYIHTLTVASSPAEAIHCPSGLNLRLLTLFA